MGMLLKMKLNSGLKILNMTEILHIINHCSGFCGENHPSFLTFMLGHNEVGPSIHYLKLKFFKR